MSSVIYPAIAWSEAEGGYKAEFVDLRGVTAAAQDMDALVRAAREALLAKLNALAEEGADWPPASPLDKARAAAGDKGALLMIDVEAEDAPVRVNISVGERLLKRIDAAAEAAGMTRSAFIAAAARAKLGEAGSASGWSGTWTGGRVDFEAAARRLQDELTSVGRRLTDTFGPDSAFSRSMAEWDRRVYDTVQKTADNVSAAMARRKERHGGEGGPPEGGGPSSPTP
ncbi:MAG: type II toxin-antitoxin system HicB family antitoxin [Caulobacteraceae bacterium]